MNTSSTRPGKFSFLLCTIVTAFVLAAMIGGICAESAFGQRYNSDGRYYDQRYNRDSRYYGYATNPGYYEGQRYRRYYYPAPVYAPPPVVYYPAPYQSPGINFVFPIVIR